ncbi:polyhydroxyalkanoate synthase [Herbaspirillum sp. Sphag1AN]|uniref:PHA/PHB synthase family protein n=1 Tax=unclassified Herbaspirillum TaxID=2624150 RepID=UPI00160C5D8E|nr:MULTISPECIES: alpha/beta fold hydrolase [unclassified Herbaspirillum]MBB3212179.1 polyhydroxyalkanoate synthase [Herbaspirillum sp. Sphag1AN]MBB3243987.1 polyhydroxyalkanoate synthase [Herbaspirillum sp. Sphag64]
MTDNVAPETAFSSTAVLDQQFHAALAKMTSSLSIGSAALAGVDWGIHLAVSPGKRIELAMLAMRQSAQLLRYVMQSPWHRFGAPDDNGQVLPLPVTDRRFADPAWQQWPFNLLHQSFLLNEQWWSEATSNVWGVERHHADVVGFAARQWLDIFSPGNQLATNPEVLHKTIEERGANLLRGLHNELDNTARLLSGTPAAGLENFTVGQQLAVTPGKVVLKNQLIELMQYTPTTSKVHPEPIFIVPAWIMKYYILDLSPHNSMIKYLVDQGHTVFCLSWKNPGPDERNLGMDDYLQQGIVAALGAIGDIVPKQAVHAVGYCLGGTLLSIAAAAMARDGDTRLASMTLLAAQTDFAEPGELGLFIDDSQVSLLEAQMQEAGSLSAGQMAGAFQMLRSYDLLWSQLIKQALMGERDQMNDLMAWNADATRMPARMHSEYLRRLFLHDDLSQGRYPVAGRPIALSDIDLPLFMVGTVTDHVAPWRSVHKMHYLSPAEITFVLTSGGHNAGIVSEPGHPHRHYQMLTRAAGGNYVAPDQWQAEAPSFEGSWWTAWQQWLAQRSSPPHKPPQLGSKRYPASADAPGSYVLEK